MKVLMITTSYPDFEESNRGIFIRRLCRELANNRIEVIVLTPRIFHESPLYEEEQGIHVHRFRFPSGNRPLNQLESIPVFPMCVYMLSGLMSALRIIFREKPDVIHGNWIVPTGLIASLAGLLTGTPVINTARGMDMRVSEKGIIKALFNLAVRLSDKVTIVSEVMRERSVLSNAELITSGVNETFFSRTPIRNHRTVLYARSLERIYDAGTLIRAVPHVLKSIPDAQFVIAGSGSQLDDLKKTAEILGISDSIDFLGHVAHNRVSELMKAASVYVSTATADGTSIALMEAIAAGLIPVVSDINANKLLVKDGKDGFLFLPEKELDLADKIIFALTEGIPPSVLDQKRYIFREIAGWSSIANRFISSYNHIAGNKVK